MSRLILASASPQRKTLLAGLGVSFDVVHSVIDEAVVEEADPVRRAVLLAQLKAHEVAERHPGCVVIGCDTLVVSGQGHLLEKPKDADDARRMLQLQSGTTSLVHSGLSVISSTGKAVSDVNTSRVTFKKLSSEEMEWWIGTGLWKDRSGSFQIDGPGQLMIEKIEGDWSGIVGLPVFLLGELLRQAGEPVLP
jgi:septum formation protein